MSSPMVFAPHERERLAVLVNNISIFAGELISQSSSNFSPRALSNLADLKIRHQDLLKRLDKLAREKGDESPLWVIEDLARALGDVAQMLTLVRRCLLVLAFLGHCMAQPIHPQSTAAIQTEGKRLH